MKIYSLTGGLICERANCTLPPRKKAEVGPPRSDSNMAILKHRTRPEPWQRQRAQANYVWLIPVFALEWGWRWLAYLLSGWAFLEVLEYFGTLSLLVAAVSYFAESNDRIKQKHYQAWQVIDSAQGKGEVEAALTRLRNFIRMVSHW